MSAFELNHQQIVVKGKITFATIMQLIAGAQQLIGGQEIHSVDLQQVEQCDSASLLLLLNFFRIADQKKQTLQFLNSPDQILRLAKLSNLDTVFNFV